MLCVPKVNHVFLKTNAIFPATFIASHFPLLKLRRQRYRDIRDQTKSQPGTQSTAVATRFLSAAFGNVWGNAGTEIRVTTCYTFECKTQLKHLKHEISSKTQQYLWLPRYLKHAVWVLSNQWKHVWFVEVTSFQPPIEGSTWWCPLDHSSWSTSAIPRFKVAVVCCSSSRVGFIWDQMGPNGAMPRVFSFHKVQFEANSIGHWQSSFYQVLDFIAQAHCDQNVLMSLGFDRLVNGQVVD